MKKTLNLLFVSGLWAFATCLSAEERIISLAPHITELLFAIGAGEEIVGAVSYSDYPAAANDIPRIGSYDRISYESVLALEPSLVIGWGSGNGEESIVRLRELGLEVYDNNPVTLEDVGQSLKIFGELTGHAEEGARQSAAYFARLELLRSTYTDSAPIRLFYQLWNEPQMTVNGNHLISDVIRLCGGVNIFADAVPLVPRVSIESVVRLNPQAIIAPGMSEQRPEWLDDWYRWPSIEAVEKGHLFSINPDLMHRHSPRILDGADQLCQILESIRNQ